VAALDADAAARHTVAQDAVQAPALESDAVLYAAAPGESAALAAAAEPHTAAALSSLAAELPVLPVPRAWLELLVYQELVVLPDRSASALASLG
jgi:hypothetical protein